MAAITTLACIAYISKVLNFVSICINILIQFATQSREIEKVWTHLIVKLAIVKTSID